MQGDIKPCRCIPTMICERCTEEHNRLFEGFSNYKQQKDLFYYIDITFCSLVTVYCTCKIAKDAFRIVLYVTTFYAVQHCAVARFVLRQYFVCS